MTLTDHIKRLFATADTVENMTDAVATIELALVEARSKHAEARQTHAECAIEFVSDTAAAEKSQAAVDRASRRVEDMQAALETARARLQAAQDAQNARADAEAWDNARSLLLARSERIRRVQSLLDDLAREHAALLEETETAWNALPMKPPSRPHTFTKADIDARVQRYLYGVSDGQLGHGTNAHVARGKPDLARVAAGIDEMLLAPSAPPVATTEAATT